MTRRVDCREHGRKQATFVCQHLVHGRGLGICFDQSSSDPWPDAACDACDAERPWSHEIEVERIRLLCSVCWEEAYARNTRVSEHGDAEVWLSEARERAGNRQDRWLEEFGVEEHPHYRYDLEGEQPWLGFGESDRCYHVMCNALVIGSWGRKTNSWLWGWANQWWAPSLTDPLVRVKRYGERHGIEPLWRSASVADEDRAWALAATALALMPEIEAIYRSPDVNGSLFLAMSETRRLAS